MQNSFYVYDKRFLRYEEFICDSWKTSEIFKVRLTNGVMEITSDQGE